MTAPPDAPTVDAAWARVAAWARARFGRDVGLEGVLLLIGLHAEGRAHEPKLAKEEKERLIYEASFLVFEALGLYTRVGVDAAGAWLWERTGPAPALDADAQERLLRWAVAAYLAPYLDT